MEETTKHDEVDRDTVGVMITMRPASVTYLRWVRIFVDGVEIMPGDQA